ncbi:uncharacterized protein LOC131684070 [Topomyia yanbarensis]|uniref:uncharacterized protein LOC131684070 n=1 Tax=Topomyia yanbarensis TaxID=2498891 RepID=UPI00273CC2DD|nr:uncharacterized protein LOC131684070 [Topomyia yanbarensis]
MSQTPAELNPQRSPPSRGTSYSKIPRPTSKVETEKSSSPKQSISRVILGIDGRPTLPKEQDEHTFLNTRSVIPDAFLPNQIAQRLPPVVTFSIEERKVFQKLLDHDREPTMTNVVNPEKVTAHATLSEISNDSQEDQSRFLVGDNAAIGSGMETFPSQAVYNVVHDEAMVPDSANEDEQRLRQVTANRSNPSTYESDKKKQKCEQARIPWCWVASISMMVLIMVLILCLPLMLILLTYRMEFLERKVEQSIGRNLLLWIFSTWEQVKSFLTANI